MNIQFQTLELVKKYPLRISRGVESSSTSLMVLIEQGGCIGVGEAAPGKATGAGTAEKCQQQIEQFLGAYSLENLSPTEAWKVAHDQGVAACAYAAIDMALWDLLAKQSKQPLFHLLGLARPSVATSVTLGILPPDLVRERIPEILGRTQSPYLKVKLGSPEGIEADQEMFATVLESSKRFNVVIRVDANGGWALDDARKMMRWLADREVDYIEQPLHPDADDQLVDLFQDRAMPVFIDESCKFSADVARLAHCVDGVNLKLMKCAGITEAMRIVATARAHGLQTMIGCMGESSISISAGASIGALFDHIDLDSHLNLAPDPATGAEYIGGVVTPTDAYGHGGGVRC